MAKGKGGVSSAVLAEVVRLTGVDPAYLLLGETTAEFRSHDRAMLEEIAAIIHRAGIVAVMDADGIELVPEEKGADRPG
jgi:hypothetical protein